MTTAEHTANLPMTVDCARRARAIVALLLLQLVHAVSHKETYDDYHRSMQFRQGDSRIFEHELGNAITRSTYNGAVANTFRGPEEQRNEPQRALSSVRLHDERSGVPTGYLSKHQQLPKKVTPAACARPRALPGAESRAHLHADAILSRSSRTGEACFK